MSRRYPEELKSRAVRMVAETRAEGEWKNVDAVEYATAEWVDWFDHRRLYGYCGDIPPAEAEAAHYAHHHEPAAATASSH